MHPYCIQLHYTSVFWQFIFLDLYKHEQVQASKKSEKLKKAMNYADGRLVIPVTQKVTLKLGIDISICTVEIQKK